ncbi:hypothetical protein PYJP_13070 [Pyrofollis japonicus]|uniref:phosphoribosyl-AMP cyclohydrolase n=1 Tax=Pyrofollis japonicus TaxID=3060460 RepID=UPI00295B26A8|nr:phosphoribosyl-AMP cyclohydrolase [Pyrofollis japonicus]BEP17955.1 hypothetical protein PYJP_13070 [Pyrofollis japonicus]
MPLHVIRSPDEIDYEKMGGLVPVTVIDAVSKKPLMQAYASREAVAKTLETGYAWFYSRSRQRLWMKGETSGNTIRVLRVVADCDLDSLIYEGVPSGPVCHTGAKRCFHNPVAEGRSEALWQLVLEAFREARVVPRKGYAGLDQYLYVINPITDNIPPINPLLLQLLADTLAEQLEPLKPDAVMVPEALGLPLGTLVAQQLAKPMIIVRKRQYEAPGIEISYASGYEEGKYYVYGLSNEYKRVAIVDDTVSTGGTAIALLKLLEQRGHEVVAIAAALAKPQYRGVDRIKELGHQVTRILDLYVQPKEDNAMLQIQGHGIIEGRKAELIIPIKQR